MNEYLRCYAEVNLDAIKHNIDAVRGKIGDKADIMAVIKADGYGHGALKVAEAIKDKVQYLGVATIEEAVELRQAGVLLPILILGYTPASQFKEVLKYDITQTIYSLEMANAMNEASRAAGVKGKVHIAIDTGMTRIGFPVTAKSIDDVKMISEMPYIYLEGMFSHFSCADMEDKEYSTSQMEKYDWFSDELDKRNISIPIRHLCNSAGIIEFDDHRFNMVRSGIITYGLYPSDEVNKDVVRLKPALSWKTHVVNVQTVPEGVGVSYGATYVTKKVTKIATLSVGYADGYPRSLSNRGRVLIHGKFAPIIGRVCMDQMMVDITDIDDVRMEDVATLVGSDGENTLSVEEVANLSGSFNYEFVCGISSRVKRLY